MILMDDSLLHTFRLVQILIMPELSSAFRWRDEILSLHEWRKKIFLFAPRLAFAIVESVHSHTHTDTDTCCQEGMMRDCNKNKTGIFTCGFIPFNSPPSPAPHSIHCEAKKHKRRKVISSMVNKLYSARFII